MKLSKRGVATILAHEAIVLTAYKDVAGVWTIGAGLTAGAGVSVRPGQHVTLSAAIDGFKQKIRKYEDRVQRAIKRDLSQNVMDGATSFDFNTGAIISGSVDDKWNRGDKAAAMATLRQYVNAGGKRVRGLEIRRREEEAIIINGVYPSKPILVYDIYGQNPRTLNPEHIPWEVQPPPVIDIKPDDFVSPPLPEKKAGFSLIDLLKALWRCSVNQLLSLPKYQFALILVAMGGFFFVGSYAAMAQILEPSVGSGVDFGPVLTTLIGLLATGISVAGGFLIRSASIWFSSKTGINHVLLEDQLGARLDFALNKGIDFAEARAKAYVADPKSPVRNVTFDNMFVGWAADYVLDRVPDTLKHFNLTRQGVEQMVLARLNSIMGTPDVDSGSPMPVNAKPFDTGLEAA